MLKLARGNTASKISFDDTMDVDRGQAHGQEPDSSDEVEIEWSFFVSTLMLTHPRFDENFRTCLSF